MDPIERLPMTGNEVYEARKALKKRQKPLRALLEGRIKKLVLEDMRLQ